MHVEYELHTTSPFKKDFMKEVFQSAANQNGGIVSSTTHGGVEQSVQFRFPSRKQAMACKEQLAEAVEQNTLPELVYTHA